MKRKILHILYSFNPGGLENGLVNLINYLPSDEFSHAICVLSEGSLFLNRIRKRVPCYELRKRNGNDPSLPFRIASIIRKERVDIVHTRNWVSLVDGISGALMAGCRNIVHGEHGKEMEDLVRQPVRRRIAQRILLHFAKRVVTVSRKIAEELVSSHTCGADKVIPILNGIDCTRFRMQTGSDAQKLRRLYGIPADAFVIGTVGRLAKVKNLRCLLDLCERNEIRDQFFVLVGEGPERFSLEQEALRRSLGDRFAFLGYLPNVAEVLSTFDVFVNTSIYEGISNTILEAMSCGVPIVASKVGGTPEIVESGKTGFLVAPGDVEGLMECLKTLRGDPGLRNRFSFLARRVVEERFSLDTMIGLYRTVYRSL